MKNPLGRMSIFLSALFLTIFAFEASAQNVIRVTEVGQTQSKKVNLSLHKAMIVELPVDARDVLVSDPTIVDAVVRTARRTYLLGKGVGQTNAFFFDEAGRQILSLEIQVERDMASLDAMYKKFMPNARINVESINDNIVIAGTVANASAADRAREFAARFVGSDEQVMNMLTIEGEEQVMLKVRVAEMQRSLAKQLGVDMESVFTVGQVSFDLMTQNPFSVVGQSLTSGRGIASFTEGLDSVDTTIRALERTGLLKTLAEPNLTAISGESANFLAGGEFPVPASRDREGNVLVTFKPFGVGLGFTPVVLSEGRISLKISTEVSELSNEGAFALRGGVAVDPNTGATTFVEGVTIPALKVRRAETTVELPSGGSIVMAGLLQESTRQNIDGMPGAKDLPILGQLFRSRDFQNSETELVIIVTPYLVGAVNERELASPTDGFAAASDLETALLGRLNAVYGMERAEAPKRAHKGPVGFILE
jgi:pilus assembly protein CpaC